jgi:IS5 family transposase
LKATIDTAVETKAIRPSEFERVIVDSTVQEKAIAHPVDSQSRPRKTGQTDKC